MSKIKSIKARQVLDSRGNPTVEVDLITEEGKKYLATNPNELRLKHLKQMPLYIEWTKAFNQEGNNNNSDSNEEIQEQTPKEVLDNTVEQLKIELASELLDKLKDNTFSYFEYFVIQLLQKMGYGAFREDSGQVTGQTGDDGIDSTTRGVYRVYEYDQTNAEIFGLDMAVTYVLVFWSTTCGHCLDEIPQLQNFIQSQEKEKLKVVAIALEEDSTEWVKLKVKYPDFIHVYGEGKWDNDIGNSYGVAATPTYFILNKNKEFIAKPENIEALITFFGGQ